LLRIAPSINTVPKRYILTEVERYKPKCITLNQEVPAGKSYGDWLSKFAIR